MSKIKQMRVDYNWKEVFSYGASPVGVEGYTGSVERFTVDDVAKVISSSDGENDGPGWIAALLLKDGRFAYLWASCDNTGWGCQQNGDSHVASTLEDLVRWAIPAGDRRRLWGNKWSKLADPP